MKKNAMFGQVWLLIVHCPYTRIDYEYCLLVDLVPIMYCVDLMQMRQMSFNVEIQFQVLWYNVASLLLIEMKSMTWQMQI